LIDGFTRANNVDLQGSRLITGGALNITATTGNINTNALQVTQTAPRYNSTCCDLPDHC
jgi:hypothetical protein